MYSRKTMILLVGLLLHALPKAQPVQRYSVIIDEIFPDPSPPAGLPNSEYIELRNNSPSAVNLKNWRISDGSNMAGISSEFILSPDSLVILCPSAAASSFAPYGQVIAVTGFPSLNNDADIIYLLSPDGNLVHAVSYTDNWYRNDIKKEGGWSLEMIDEHFPCMGAANWIASKDARGGTPGRVNSQRAANKDEQAPALLRTYTIDSITIVAVFDEPLDSLSAANPSAYYLSEGIGKVLNAAPQAPLYSKVLLTLPSAMTREKMYELKISGITDCAGNTIGFANKAKAGRPSTPSPLDIVLNELLFNPAGDGSDYIELYNRSAAVFDLSEIYIASRNSTGSLTAIKSISQQPCLLFPGEYIVLTENKDWLMQHYFVQDPAHVSEMPALPSMPDEQGNLVLSTVQGVVVDEVSYTHQWHFALLKNEEGVALERISYQATTQSGDNWTSASSSSGYGTPTYLNSQAASFPTSKASVSISPKIFSPDNDGIDDYASIQYELEAPGFVANITVFDGSGRPVRRLVQQAILGQSGFFRWDGLDDRKMKLGSGVYIVVTEIFNLQGKTQKFKNSVVIAYRF